MSALLSVDIAIEKILENIKPLSTESIHLTNILGRILAADIRSDINLPPFDNSSMDGYAIRAQDSHSASSDQPVSLTVVMDIPAGKAPTKSIGAGEAARIMTGAPMPDGADAVIPVEDTDDNWSKDSTTDLPENISVYQSVQTGDYIRPIGENIEVGQVVLKAGTSIRAQEIGILAGIGCVQVPVFRQPRVVILGTGDELVDIDQPLSPGKIRDTNSYTLAALVERHGGIPIRLPIASDNLDSVRHLFQEALSHEPDIIISSAGVSVGTADLVRTVLDELGEIDFWRINLRPGKPLAYGQIHGIPFFGLPGNPVSAMVTFEVLVLPALNKLSGRPSSTEYRTAIVAEDMTSDGRRSYIRVKLKQEGEQWIASSTGTQSSGALMSMVLSDGLLIIPEDMKNIPKGTQLQVHLLR